MQAIVEGKVHEGVNRDFWSETELPFVVGYIFMANSGMDGASQDGMIG